MNHSGMALASDTITTLGGSKTLGNSSKIYELGDTHKVVVLHNGSVNINNVSSLLHVTEWSLQLSKPLLKLEDYINSFVEWFNSPRAIFGSESADVLVEEAIKDYFNWINAGIRSALNATSSNTSDLEEFESEKPKVISKAIDDKISASKSWPLFDGFSDTAGDELIKKQKDLNLKEIIAECFSEVILSPSDLRKLQKSTPIAITRQSRLDTDCELVFAGFGSNEAFASIVRVMIRGSYGGRLRFHIAGRDEVKATHPVASLYPLAQDDAIHGFVRGWTNSIREQVINSVFNSVWDVFEEGEIVTDPGSISSLAEKVKTKVIEELDGASLERFAYPLMNTVSAMSLISLSELAESLIGIQAASTYSKTGAATVGGFVEVVTIDRLYGVRWRKRLNEKAGQ